MAEIFESLNDKGMPLKANELLCNFLFRPIIDADMPYEDLHNSKWLAAMRVFDTDDMFEEYLRCLFSIAENKMVGKGRKLYVHCKFKYRGLAATQATEVIHKIHYSASDYRSIRNPRSARHSDNNITSLLVGISDTRMDSSGPFVLSVLAALKENSLPLEKARAILKETLVLLVRRKATELSTTQYDVMFPSLLSKIWREPDIIKAIQEQFRQANVWVSNQEFTNALIYKPTFRKRDPSYSRMILVEIDKAHHLFGQLPDYSTVNTIEHVLPQTLSSEWKSYLGADALSEQLPVIVHTVGNLCLLSGPANSSAGQNPFEAKQQSYTSITALTRQIITHQGPWGIPQIMERSQRLAQKACEIWAWSV